MKVTRFIIASIVCAALIATLRNAISLPSAAIPVITILFTILPAIIALWSERTRITIFCKEYLSLKHTYRRAVITTVASTAIALPLIMIAIVGIAGDIAGWTPAGSLSIDIYSALGLFTISTTSLPAYIGAVIVNMIVVMIAGSVIGIVNTIFEETAWRGFLNRHLGPNRVSKAVITGSIWTVWWLGMQIIPLSVEATVYTFALNILLSYYLDDIADKTGSVWASSMTRGVVNMAIFSPMFLISDSNINRIITIAAVAVMIMILPKLHAKKRQIATA